ncbi:MAG: TOBE domain-containing protein, partial [Arenicella sp.]
DQEEALAISDNIIVLKDGIIAQQGSPRDLYESPKDTFVADFIGNANVVDAEIVSLQGKAAIVDIGGVEIKLPHRDLSVGSVKVAIHPRAVSMKPINGAAPSLEGNVNKATYLGGHMEYMLDCALGELFVINHQIESPITQGSNVNVNFDMRGVSLIDNV